MTQDEERQYLCDLIMSASEWRLSEGDERDTLRLEIQDRLRRLNGVETEDENGYIQSDPVEVSPVITDDDFTALEAAKLNEHLSNKDKLKRKWASKRVRVVIDGKPTWKLRSECHKEVMPGWQTKLHWVWNGPDADKEPAVDKLSDELWKEHEASNG